MSTHPFADTLVLTGRSLKHVMRSFDSIVTTAVTPIAMMLLFVYVVGDVRRLTEVPHMPRDASVFVDVGCYHGLRPAGRRMVAQGVARLAAPRSSLLVVGMDRRPGIGGVGVTADGLAAEFPDWQVEPGQTFALGVVAVLRRARFRVFRLTKEV